MANDMGDSDSKYVENRVELVDGLKYVEDIAEQLVLCGALPRIAVEKILLEYKTPDERNGELLDVVQKHCAYDIFAHCLLVSDQHELHELMVDKVGVQPVTDELTTLQYRVYCKDGRGVPKEIQVPPHIQKLLEEQRKALQRMENVERLVDLIEEEGCLTSETAREIKQPTDDKDKVNMLVDHMKELKLHSYFVLAMFLDISQKKDLLKEITDESSRTALQRMDDLRLKVYYNQLGTIALQDSELEARLGITAREFVTLRINSDSNAVDRRGFSEAHVDQSKAKEIKLTDLFSDQEYKEPTKKVLLIGAPGTGKTSATAQLARDATTKKALNIPRPPFIILLRSIEWKNHTSLKKLLVNHGPKLKETVRDEVWEALSKHADDVTVILDGADEVPGGFFKRQAGQVAGEESQALPRDILNNLISGKLLKGARVLVSTRPFGLDSCWDNFSRKVEVVGFNKKSLHRFLSNELPEKIKEVQSFLATHVEVKSLLLIPLNAATFVLRAKNPQHTDNWLLQSRTELSLSLIDTLVKTMLRKDHGGSIPRVDLKKPGKNLRKLSKHVAELLYSKGAVKTEMTSEDLEKAEISVDECVATGVFSEQVVDEDGVSDSILIVPHQSILESLAALGLEEQQILKLVADNDGRHDLVLTYVAGILGNERNRKMLEYVLIEEDKEKDFKKLAETVVRAILGSKRRLLRYDGEEFCQRIVVESQQWDFIADLMRVMGSRWLTPYSTEAVMLADQLVKHDPRGDTDDPLVRVEVHSISNVRYCPRATALWLDDDATAAEIAENVEHLRNITAVSFSCADITRETVAKLSKLNNVKAVNMDYSEVGSASDESSVLGGLSISSLQFLRLSHCGLSCDDVAAVTSLCRRLLHLDISRNRGVRGGDVRSRKLTGLDVAGCRMEVEELVELAATNGETLTYLNASGYYSNSVLTSSHINALLTRCPRLVEMYTDDGGELVRALSERRAACRLNHLWLFNYDLSSSSSSGRHVNSSELSDVITRHSSISSLTLYKCSHFTPDVMSHLSSSMTAITSLYISPHPARPYHPRPSDVASLVRASRSLKQLWLDGVQHEWRVSDYIEVIDAVNASPALCVIGLEVYQLTLDEVRVVVRAMTRPLTRLWLAVNYRNKEVYREVVLEKEPGVVQLVWSLYSTYVLESGSFLQHLPPSLPDHFRPVFW